MSKKAEETRGRHTIYSQDLADRICRTIAITPLGLRKICDKHPDFPHPDTIRVWRLENDLFSALYAKAKLAQADVLADDCLDIADDTTHDTKINIHGEEVANSEFVNRSRLRIDTRKWLASKLLPKQYGERQQTDVTVKHEDSIKDLE